MTTPSPILVDSRRARELLCVGKTKFYELIARDDFPKPRNVPGVQKHMWLYTDLEAWASGAIDNRVGA